MNDTILNHEGHEEHEGMRSGDNDCLQTLDTEDHIEIIIHRDRGGVRARVHASYIAGRVLKCISQGEGGALLLDAVDRCARAIHQAGDITTN